MASGIFVGAFAISSGLWFALWLKKRYTLIPLQSSLILIISFILTVIPLMKMDDTPLYFPVFLIGNHGNWLNKVYWINPIVFGSLFGSAVVLLSYWLHIRIKKLRGKVLFPFQGIVLTLMAISIVSMVFYFVL